MATNRKSSDENTLTRTLRRFNTVQDKPCLTITARTFRSGPETRQNKTNLRNLIKRAKMRLRERQDEKTAKLLSNRLDTLAESINHRNHQSGIGLFVNEDMSDVIQFPFDVDNRVIVDRTFATRDLLRMLREQTAYFVLALSRKKARLIQGLNDRLVKEHGDPFPIENTKDFPPGRQDSASGAHPTQLIRHFFNRVDQGLHEIKRDRDLPVVVCTEKSNYPEFLKVSAFRNSIIGHLKTNRPDDKNEKIIKGAWPIAEEHRKITNREKLLLMESEYKTGNVKTTLPEIWQAISEGRGRILFVENDYFQPAQITDDGDCSFNEEMLPKNGRIYDDIVDEMVERIHQFGGQAVFLDETETEADFHNLALITRY